MKNLTLEKIWNFIKSKSFVAIIIIGLILFSAQQCSTIREITRQKTISEQNESALKDSLYFERTKKGELLVTIDGYIATEKELKTLNKDLWERVKAQDGKIISLNHTIVQLVQDSATLKKYLKEKDKLIQKLLKIDSSTYVAPWKLTYKYDSTNFDVFTGKTYIGVLSKDPLELAHIDTELTKRLTQIDLTWGQKIEKNSLRVFIQSNYPGFTVTQMEGVLIDPNTNPYFKELMKKKKWFSGISVGFGATAGYNLTDGKYGLVIGPTISYNIYSW